MRFKTLWLVIVLGLACQDMLLYRSGANYFPIFPGGQWRYLLDTDTIIVEVDTRDTTIASKSCVRIYRNFAPEYYIASPNEIWKLVVSTMPRPGGEDTVEFRFGLRYRLPFVLGDRFQDHFDTILIRGPDTVQFVHTFEVRVSGVDSVRVPAGAFFDCYRLEFTELVVKPETVLTQWVEWLAPGVGVVQCQRGNEKEVLIEYRR
ncbi:MAG: TapB family protein [bacterium]